MSDSVLEQIRKNLISIISLVIAIMALSVNTWRTNISEDNRNLRQASFEMIKQLGQLQILVNHAHYDKNQELGNPITGWGHVALIEDLSVLLPPPAPNNAQDLKAIWKAQWEWLGKNNESEKAISDKIRQLRSTTKQIVISLY